MKGRGRESRFVVPPSRRRAEVSLQRGARARAGSRGWQPEPSLRTAARGSYRDALWGGRLHSGPGFRQMSDFLRIPWRMRVALSTVGVTVTQARHQAVTQPPRSPLAESVAAARGGPGAPAALRRGARPRGFRAVVRGERPPGEGRRTRGRQRGHAGQERGGRGGSDARQRESGCFPTGGSSPASLWSTRASPGACGLYGGFLYPLSPRCTRPSLILVPRPQNFSLSLSPRPTHQQAVL